MCFKKASIVGLILCLLLGVCVAQAQTCENGKCFKTPVRNGLSAIAEAQPIASTVNAIASARPVASTVNYFTTNKPVRGLLGRIFGRHQQAANYVSSYSYEVSSYEVCGCGCGMAGCTCQQASSFRVGGVDSQGHVITWIGEAKTVDVSSSPSVSALGLKSRRQSREVILDAAKQAHDSGTINSDEYRAIRLAVHNPKMLSKIEDLIISKAQSSGAYSFTLDSKGDVVKAAIDWTAIGDFILKIAPIIFKLIEMFALDTSPAAGEVMYASAIDQSPNFVATIGLEFFTAC